MNTEYISFFALAIILPFFFIKTQNILSLIPSTAVNKIFLGFHYADVNFT